MPSLARLVYIEPCYKLLFLGFPTSAWEGLGEGEYPEVLRNNCFCYCCFFICLCLLLVNKLDLQPESDTTPLHILCIKVPGEFWIKINFVFFGVETGKCKVLA